LPPPLRLPLLPPLPLKPPPLLVLLLLLLLLLWLLLLLKLLLQRCLKLQGLFFLKQAVFYKLHLALCHLQQPPYPLLVLRVWVKRLCHLQQPRYLLLLQLLLLVLSKLGKALLKLN
jgi:hypothetical protein